MFGARNGPVGEDVVDDVGLNKHVSYTNKERR